MQNLPADGERMLPEMLHSTIIIEHLHRYAMASLFCKDKVVLDIASGEGYGTNLLSHVAKHVTGVDIDPKAVDHARLRYKKDNLEYKLGSATQIPMPNHSLDVVVSYETIEHHDQHDEMIKEIKRVLKPDGLCIVSTPDKKYYSDIPKLNNPWHVKELYQVEFDSLMKKYFSEVQMIGQQCGTISAIFPMENGTTTESWLAKGTTESIEIGESLEPVFLIALASEVPINYKPISFFKDASLSQTIYEGQLEGILNSRTYRLGNALLKPFKWVRSLIRPNTSGGHA